MMLEGRGCPVLGFAAWSGTGKTTLLLQLLPLLLREGIRIGVIKHAHHEFDVDHAGKDSYKLRHAGAAQILVTSCHRWALMGERPCPHEPNLQEALLRLDHSMIDLILVEGFKDEAFPKIELHRPSLQRPLLFPRDQSIIAVAVDAPIQPQPALPVLSLNDPHAILDFILHRVLTSCVATSPTST